MTYLATKLSLSRLLLALCALCLAGCVTPPSEQELKTAHYGRYPANHRSAINELLNDRHDKLGDPFKMISVSRPQKDWMGDAGNRTWGYSSEVAYQAPNPAVGANIYIYREKVFFHNGRVVNVSNTTNLGDVMGSAVANNVASASLQFQVGNGGGGEGDGGDAGDGGDQSDDQGNGGTTTKSGRHSSGHSGGRTSASRRTAGSPRAARSPHPTAGRAKAKAAPVKAKKK